MTQNIIAQGAEAVIILNKSKDKNNPSITKQRISKSYRIPEIDERIRKLRTRSESKLLEKASKIINIPKVIKTDEKNKIIEMDFIKGEKLSESLNSMPEELQLNILKQIGKDIAKLHDVDIIHGDLTTSNMIYAEGGNNNYNDTNNKTKNINLPHKSQKIVGLTTNKREPIKIYFIDFGLGFQNGKFEDKAVDVHLLKQALEAKHFQNWEKLYREFLEGYKNSKNYDKTLNQLSQVEKRGRYRH